MCGKIRYGTILVLLIHVSLHVFQYTSIYKPVYFSYYFLHKIRLSIFGIYQTINVIINIYLLLFEINKHFRKCVKQYIFQK